MSIVIVIVVVVVVNSAEKQTCHVMMVKVRWNYEGRTLVDISVPVGTDKNRCSWCM